MGKRKGPAPEASAEDLELFAAFVRSEEQAERTAKTEARAQRRQADEVGRLQKAKEAAAAEVKRLRASDRATAEEKAAADAAYKAALAAVVAAETGEAPTWAPPPTDAAEPATPEAPEEPEDQAPAEADEAPGDPEAGDLAQ